MDIFTSVLLGVVQGLTEFVPISSSGHLIIVREVLGISSENGLAFDAVLQLATSLAIFVYFRKDITRLFKRFFHKGPKEESVKAKTVFWAILIGTIPAVFFGLLLEESADTLFRNTHLVVWTLIGGAILMWLSEQFLKKGLKENKEISINTGFWIGLFQALAIIPGVSRSGSTIAGGLFLGLSRIEATRFSFMLGFPILFGSGIKKLIDLGVSGQLGVFGLELLVGSLTAFVVGLFAMSILMRYLKNHSLNLFVVYRFVLAGALFLFLF